MELKATNHSYYCNDENYFRETQRKLETWQDFKDDWLGEGIEIDHDFNHCFRFDIKPLVDSETDEEYGDRFSLYLYIMVQRKGAFVPVEIKEIKKEDMKEIEEYLSQCWSYLKGQWSEFSKEEKR